MKKAYVILSIGLLMNLCWADVIYRRVKIFNLYKPLRLDDYFTMPNVNLWDGSYRIWYVGADQDNTTLFNFSDNPFPQNLQAQVPLGEFFELRLGGLNLAKRFKEYVRETSQLMKEKVGDKKDITLIEAINEIEGIKAKGDEAGSDELKRFDDLIKTVNEFITEKALANNTEARKFIELIAEEFGQALGFYVANVYRVLRDRGIQKENILKAINNIVLVGGVAENMGIKDEELLKTTQGGDLFLEHIKKGMEEVLNQVQDRFGLTGEQIAEIISNIKRGKAEKRDLLAFPPKDKNKYTVVLRAHGTTFEAGIVYEDGGIQVITDEKDEEELSILWRKELAEFKKRNKTADKEAIRDFQLELMAELIKKAITRAKEEFKGKPLEAIYISWAGPGEYWNGKVRAPNIAGFEDELVELRDELLKKLKGKEVDDKVNIEIFHDGIAAAMGEANGNKMLTDRKNILAVIWGTGIGAGLLLDERPYYDYTKNIFSAPLGEIGHHIVFQEAREIVEYSEQFSGVSVNVLNRFLGKGSFNPQKAKVVVFEIDLKEAGIGFMFADKFNGRLFANREEDEVVYIDEQGREERKDIYYMNEIRKHLPTIVDYNQQFQSQNPSATLIATMPASNVLWNDWYVGWADGKLYYRYGEDYTKREYTSLIIWKNGKASIENIRFKKSEGEIRVISNGRDITDNVAYLTSGQPVLQQGRIADIPEVAKKWDDLRHLLTFPTVNVDIEGEGKQSKRYFGLGYLLKNKEVLENALRGKIVEIPTTDLKNWLKRPLNRDEIKNILRNSSYKKFESYRYEEASSPKDIAPGEFYVASEDLVKMRFKRGLYPHTAIGVKDDGNLVILQIHGISREQGAMVEEVADYLRLLGAKDAIIICNGGDVVTFSDKLNLNIASEATVKDRNGFSGVMFIYNP